MILNVFAVDHLIDKNCREIEQVEMKFYSLLITFKRKSRKFHYF